MLKYFLILIYHINLISPQMGKGRTTTGMIVACLVRDVVHGQVKKLSLILMDHFTCKAGIKIRRHYFEIIFSF